MKKILWIPIIGESKTPLYHRKIGTPILWEMSQEQSELLEQDWHELNELMLTGQFDLLSAEHGQYLQCRPKAQNSNSQIPVTLSEGTNIRIVPKGYYLRTTFTKQIIRSYYQLELE